MTRKPSDAARDGSGARSAEHAPISDPVLEAVEAAREIVHFYDSDEISGPHYFEFMLHVQPSTIVDISRALLSLSSRVENARDEWQPIETAPKGPHETYLLASSQGHVAPCIRGIIHNNVGTAWDWNYGEAATHWRPLPAPPSLSVK